MISVANSRELLFKVILDFFVLSRRVSRTKYSDVRARENTLFSVRSFPNVLYEFSILRISLKACDWNAEFWKEINQQSNEILVTEQTTKEYLPQFQIRFAHSRCAVALRNGYLDS